MVSIRNCGQRFKLNGVRYKNQKGVNDAAAVLFPRSSGDTGIFLIAPPEG